MSKPVYARLFQNGRSQAVRLPREFRFDGDRVRIRKVGNTVILEPDEFDVESWFAEMDRLGDGRFMEDGRDQPEMQAERDDIG